jgi:hypothetical protein
LRIFATKAFARFARKERLENRRLAEAIARAEHGSIEAELGGGLIKQRVGGRSGGYRTVIAYRAEQRSVFCMASPRVRAGTSTIGNSKP